MPSATHQLIHGSPPQTQQLIHGHGIPDESDDGYRTHSSSSSSCSDGNSPQSQSMTSESPPPGIFLEKSKFRQFFSGTRSKHSSLDAETKLGDMVY